MFFIYRVEALLIGWPIPISLFTTTSIAKLAPTKQDADKKKIRTGSNREFNSPVFWGTHERPNSC